MPAETLARIFGTVNPLPNLEPTWNMAPTKDAPVVRLSRDGERHLDALKWGLVPYFTKDLKKARKPINARSETVAASGMFREAFAKRRCLVPAPVYYEWREDPESKTPFGVARVDSEPVAFGGIWETWKSPVGDRLLTFATITTEANVLLAPIQDRMPVIIERADWPLWLGEVDGDVTTLLRAAPEDALRLWPVDKKVGQVRNDGPDLIEPVPEVEATLLLSCSFPRQPNANLREQTKNQTMPAARPLPSRIGSVEFGMLGGMVALRCPEDFVPIVKRAGATWEPGSGR